MFLEIKISEEGFAAVITVASSTRIPHSFLARAESLVIQPNCLPGCIYNQSFFHMLCINMYLLCCRQRHRPEAHHDPRLYHHNACTQKFLYSMA